MKVLILDRDGVINEDSPAFIKSAEEWRPIPGSLRAIARATQLGYRIIVVSNQSGLARKLFTIETLNRIHRRLHDEVNRLGGKIEAIFFCPHDPAEGCECRKPNAGLLDSVARRLQIDLSEATFVGDRLSDIRAAQSRRLQPILVHTGNGLDASSELADSGVWQCKDLAEAVDRLRTTLK